MGKNLVARVDCSRRKATRSHPDCCYWGYKEFFQQAHCLASPSLNPVPISENKMPCMFNSRKIGSPWPKLVLLLPFLLLVQVLAAQALRFMAPSMVYCQPDASFSCNAILYNAGTDTVSFVQQPFENAYFLQLQASGATRVIAPGDSMRLQLRFLNRLGKINGDYQLPIVLKPASGNPVRILFPVRLHNGMEPRVFAELLQEQVLVMPGEMDIKMPVRLRSFLPAGTPVVLELARPHNSFQLQQPHTLLYLPQMRDTIIQISLMRMVEKKGSFADALPVQLHLRTEGGSELARFTFLPQVLASARPLFFSGKPASGLRLGVATAFSNTGSLQTDYTAAYQPGSPADPLAWQLHYRQFSDVAFRQMNASWLQYKKNGSELHLGTINDYHELNLQGRGVRVTQNLGTDKWQVRGWWVDNNMNLLSSYKSGGTEQVKSAELEYAGLKGGSVIVNSSWFQRRYSFSQGNLQFAEWRPHSQNNNFLAVRVGTSMERFAAHDTLLRGVSTQLEGQVLGKYIGWFGQSLYASPGYAGNQRGLLSGTLQGNLRNTSQYNVGMRWNLFSLKIPDALQRMVGAQQQLNQTFELQTAFMLRKTSVSLRPYLLMQQQQFPLLLAQAKLRSEALNTSVMIGRSLGKVHIGGNWDGGLQQTVRDAVKNKANLAWRSSLNLSYQQLLLSATMQKGGYYLWQQQAAAAEKVAFRNYSFNAAYGGAIGKHLLVQSSAFAAYNSVLRFWQYSMVQQLSFTAGPYTAQASLLYTAGNSSFVQVSAGVQRQFLVQHQPKDVVKLRIGIYEDKNGNAQRDEREPWVSGQLVEVDGILMVTNTEGFLYISSIKKGTHQLRILPKGNAVKPLLEQQLTLANSKDMVLGIPPLFTIKGRVIARADRYTGKAEQVGNIRVVLSGTNGELTSFTLADGSFSFDAPAGTYQVLIDQLRRRKAEGAQVGVVVDPQKGFAGNLELVWTAGERPVQVKKVKIQ